MISFACTSINAKDLLLLRQSKEKSATGTLNRNSRGAVSIIHLHYIIVGNFDVSNIISTTPSVIDLESNE